MSYLIPAFPPVGLSHRQAFRAWKQQVLSALTFLGPQERGLLGFALPADQWLLVPGVDGPFVALVRPDRPAANAAAATISFWKNDQDQFMAERSAVLEATAKIIACLDIVARQVIEDPVHGTRNRTLLEILTLIEAEYGIVTVAEIRRLKVSLADPWDPSTEMGAHVQRHEEIHAILHANHEAISHSTKTEFFFGSLSNLSWEELGHPFREAIVFFYNTHATIDTQTWAAAKRAIITAYNSRTSTMGSLGYAAPTSAVATKRVETAKHYCWTHGPGRHSSADCQQPATGHKTTATMANKQGGRAKKWQWQRS